MSHGERVFHHSEAARLESPDRLAWLPPSEIIAALNVRSGMTVADIGAGTGYFSIPFAAVVGHRGHLYAVDLQREMLTLLAGKPGVTTLPLSLHHGDASHTTLNAGSCDLAFFANVWHEIDDIPAALNECRRIVAPGGKLALVDWRKDVSPPPGPPVEHRIDMAEAITTLAENGWKNVKGTSVGKFSYLVQGTSDGW
jgi:ubiquinone/menaquinone biosynthesis C-methylase UbiE